MHIVGIPKTAYGLTTPRCLDWQHESNRISTDTAQGNPGAAGRTRLPGWFRHGGAEHISLRGGGVAPRNVTPVAGTVTSRQERLAAVSWPADGVSAADISGFGVVAGPGATRPVPIASVAKVMTAYVILHDHPLPAGGSGPDITVQPSEAAAYPSQVRDGDSLVPVAAGEMLTERQALEALLLPSADNMAWILARWDAGSQAAFAARMNATARRLGMTGTSYTDPSGLDPSTTSTAADQVRLGMAAMRVPVLAAIAAMPTAVVPVAGAGPQLQHAAGPGRDRRPQDRQHAGRRRMRSHRGLAQGGRAQHPDRGRHFRPARHGRDHPAERIASRPQPRACPGSRPRLWRAVRFA